MTITTAKFHLPGLFEFHDLYELFLNIYKEHRIYFYDYIEITSIYGCPSDYIWSGGRVSSGNDDIYSTKRLLKQHNLSANLTFSNLFIKEEHLSDRKCNDLCKLFNESQNGIVICSDILLNYIKNNYPNYHFISSTTKVLTNPSDLINELRRNEFSYVVPDFRLNKNKTLFNSLNQNEKDKIELLVNECCDTNCAQRKVCYENVSKKILGIECEDHKCYSPESKNGYVFSKAMKNPAFISNDDIINYYLPLGITNFKIEGRGLGSALVLEILLYYLAKPEYQLNIREQIYLSNSLNF